MSISLNFILLDSIAWKNCFDRDENFETEANDLLFRGILPDQGTFWKICQTHGRKSVIVQEICKGIGQYIKGQSGNIINVWPAYEYAKGSRLDANRIFFVVITKEPIVINVDFHVYQRNENEISSLNEQENRSIREQEKSCDVDIGDIKSCLSSNATKLMASHRNLTWVTASGIKSSGYRRSMEHKLKKIPCIALYVQIKGLIPIEEEPFEEVIDGYPVDVREGVFKLCGLSTDLHQHIRIGCAIDSGFGTKQGTVGPFFKYESDPEMYLVTCAHVLLETNQMQQLLAEKQVNYGLFGNDTYQPPESISVGGNSRHHLGKTVLAAYRTGGNGKSGTEIAFVQINKDRRPMTGYFPYESQRNLTGRINVSNILIP